MSKRIRPVALSTSALIAALTLSGCMPMQTRGAAGRGTGYGTVDLSIGVLPVSGSLNPDQNLYPGFAKSMDDCGFFRSVEPVASAQGKQFDLLLMAGPPGFAPEIKVVSGYSNQELFRKKFTALYGYNSFTGQYGGAKAARELAKVFAVGTPAYQQVISEREVFRRQHPAPMAPAPAASAPVAVPAPALTSSDVDSPSFRNPERPDDYALVVGIDKYSNELPEAQFAERDAQAVKNHLVALGFPQRNIKLLAGSRASKANLDAYLEDWLPRNVKEDSVVFFYFSGHGAFDPESSQAFLVPWDGNPNYLKRTAYPVKSLYARLDGLKAAQVIVALDSCFSGAGGRSVMAKGTRPLANKVDVSVPQEGKIVLFAATSPHEVTSTLEEQGHGIFTYYFLKGLGGEAQDQAGVVTARGLYQYLKPKVQDAASQQNRDQTPVLEGSAQGELTRFP